MAAPDSVRPEIVGAAVVVKAIAANTFDVELETVLAAKYPAAEVVTATDMALPTSVEVKV
jgi:hypothetical protein